MLNSILFKTMAIKTEVNPLVKMQYFLHSVWIKVPSVKYNQN